MRPRTQSLQFPPVSRLWLGLCLSALAWGQASSSINGTVTDPSGAQVPGANITLREVETNLSRTTVSNTDGLYLLGSLRPTRYTLKVEAAGFKTFTQTGISLLANDTVTINLRLELGSVGESITVEVSVVQVDTTTATLKQVVDSARIMELPLNGRNAAQLTTLVAGAVLGPANQADQGVTKTFPAAVTATVNGTRTNQTSFMLDGVPNAELIANVNLPFPMPDALQEFSVQTSNYNAEFGQSAGGVVNIVTKSGTNSFHGDVFGYLRNAAFNARNFFSIKRDPLKRGQYGGAVGGPVIRDKAFFFFGYQGTRIRSQTGGLSAFVPTLANQSGDFSALLSASNPNNPQSSAIALKDPATGQPFPNNQIPVSRLDPAALNVAKNWLPQSAGKGSIFYSEPLAQNFQEFTLKGDYNLSDNDRLMVRYFRDTFAQLPQLVNNNMLTYYDSSSIHVTSAVIQETHIFGPSTLNDFRFGTVVEPDTRHPPLNAPQLSTFGVQNIYPCSVPTLGSFSVSGYFSLGSPQANGLARFPKAAFTWSDSLRYQRGRHSFAFGGAFERDRLDEDTEYTMAPSITFSGDSTGSAMADLMIGGMRTFSQGNGTVEHNRRNLFSLYAQDAFKINARLTMNYGLRWEPSLPWHDVYQTAEIFNPALFAQGVKSVVYSNAPPGMLFPGDPGVPSDGRRGQWNVLAPRVGFAYDVSGDGKTSIRAGLGMFYDSRVSGFNTNHMSQSSPFTIAVTLTSPQGPFSNPYLGITNYYPAPLPNPKNVPFPSPVTVSSFDPGLQLKAPVVYNGNLTIEHEIASNWLVRVAYVGSHSTHININAQTNPSVYIPGSTLSTNARRVYQGYGSILTTYPGGNSHYNSLQLSLQKRLSRGFTILANYTWSKTLDNMPANIDASSLASGTSYVIPTTMTNYESLDHGPSDFNRAHVGVVSYVWQLPGPKKTNPLLNAIAGGWQLNGIFSAQTGLPFTVQAGTDRSLSGVGLDRAVAVDGQATYTSGACANVSPCLNFLNAQAFAVPALGTFGNVGKGALTGPGLFNWDMAVGKRFPIKERATVQFRAECFNSLNHTNPLIAAASIQAPATWSLSAAGFGTLRSAADPRIIQMALKVTF